MAMRRKAIASGLTSAAFLTVCCAGSALADAAASDAAPVGGTTLVTVGGTLLRSSAAPGAAERTRAQPPVVLGPMTVDPAQSRPGATVDLRTFTDCGGTSTGEVRSAAFAAPVGLALAADGGLYAAARIAPGVKPGSYLVHEFCAGHPVAAGRIVIADLGAPGTGGGWRVLRAGTAPATTAVPAHATVPSFRRDAVVGLTLASLTGLATFALRRLGLRIRLHVHPAEADA